MADFSHSTLLPKLHQALSRRSLMREMASAGAVALATIPVVAKTADPFAEAERCGKQLADAMNTIRPGNFEVIISHEFGYSLIVDRGHKKEQEGPLLADDVTGTNDYAKWQKRLEARS